MEKKERKQLKEQVRADLTLLEENKKLKSENEALLQSGKEMGKEIISLRASIASYKSANTRLKASSDKGIRELRQVIDELNKGKKELESANAEKDAMYKQSVNSVSSLRAQIKELTKKKEELVEENEYVRKLNKDVNTQIAAANRLNKDLSNTITCLKANKEWYNNLPWYKKIFVNKI